MTKSGHAASRLSSKLNAGAIYSNFLTVWVYKVAVLLELLSNHVPHRQTDHLMVAGFSLNTSNWLFRILSHLILGQKGKATE